MKILLTTLHAKYIHNSLALPCLAAFGSDLDAEFVIREYTVHEPKQNVVASLLTESPDVIAFSVYLWNRHQTFELIDLLATINPKLKIVIGGPEVSFDGPELFASHPGLTALVRGEGEKPLHGLITAWSAGKEPDGVGRLIWRSEDGKISNGPDNPVLANLDDIASPFQNGLVETGRGFVYFETSRGCPYSCSFCMSALDETVRSFSEKRIESDLKWLIDRKVAKIKLVDRTFNYNPKRARAIFRFILENNKQSHFHFEIGAHLLDEETLELLEQVPAGMFHFEIGVQSTLPQTLTAIERRVSLEKVIENIKALKARTRIELHLDLIAGLPGEGYDRFLESIDRLFDLQPDHLQIEPVKLLPGSPLRISAKTQNLHFDPNPPYTITASPDMIYNELEMLGNIGRMIDLTWNSSRLKGFLNKLSGSHGSMSKALELLALHLHGKGLFRLPLSQQSLFEAVWDFVRQIPDTEERETLQDYLAHDYALCERVIPAKAPDFFDIGLTPAEQDKVRTEVEKRQLELRGQKIRLQYFAAIFNHLEKTGQRQVRLFFYLTKSHTGRTVEELALPGEM